MEKETTYTIVNPQGIPLAYPSVSDSGERPVGFYVLNCGKENFQRNTLGEIRRVVKENRACLFTGCTILKEEVIRKHQSFPLGLPL